ncbi:transposase [Streptomyces mirabilis]|uniref:transposase n=1 Tax=Streptomyces mirabilis TaxID=68239 RepID=UPI0036621FD7
MGALRPGDDQRCGRTVLDGDVGHPRPGISGSDGFVITTAANVNDITQTLALVDGIPPVAGRPGRPRRRPESILGDKAYDSRVVRGELRTRRIMPDISRKGAPNIKGLGKLRYVVEQAFALLHQFKPPRHPMGMTPRTPRRLCLPGMQPHLLATPQEGTLMILLRASSARRPRRLRSASSPGGTISSPGSAQPP